MCNQEALVEYIYEELSPADRQAFEAHLRGCARCRAEAAALARTRQHLRTWAPPEPDFAFHIVRGAARAAAPERRWYSRPALGLAAAAVLVLAAASAMANLEVKYGADGLTVRTGWNHAPEPARAAAATPVSLPNVADDPVVRELTQRLGELESSVAARATAVGASAPAGPRMSDAELLREVRKILAESEARQQRELALRMTQLIRDVDTTRRADLMRIQQGLVQTQGLTDAEVLRQRQMLEHLYRVTQQR